MAQTTLHIVQPFEKQGRRLVKATPSQFKTSTEAVARAERDAARYAGVVAISQTVDPETGEIEEEPVILFRHGELPQELAGED